MLKQANSAHEVFSQWSSPQADIAKMAAWTGWVNPY
jgi:hypothetical protein